MKKTTKAQPEGINGEYYTEIVDAIAAMNVIVNEQIKSKEAERDLLLKLSYDFSNVRTRDDLTRVINNNVRRLFAFENINILLLNDDPLQNSYILASPVPSSLKLPSIKDLSDPYAVECIHRGFDMMLKAEGVLVVDLDLLVAAGHATPYVQSEYDFGIREKLTLLLRDDDKMLGMLCVNNTRKETYSESTLDLIKGVSYQISTAIANILANEEILRRVAQHNYSMKIKLLIVEDQFIEANNLKIIIKKAGYAVCPIARSVIEAEAIIAAEKPDMVLLDIYLDGPETGIDLAHKLLQQNIAFVFLSANSNKQTLDAAKATNPYGFLVKPFRERDVLVMLDVALYKHQQQQPVNRLPENNVADNNAFKLIKGKSKVLTDLLEQVAVVGRSEVSVLVLGESGTGKELVAKAIHQVSKRKEHPLVVVNCAALPASLIESELFGHEKGAFTGATEKRIGKFEQADGGTIFLDEIGELPLDL